MLVSPEHKYLQYSGRIEDSNPQAPVFIFPASSVTIRFCGRGIAVRLQNRRAYWNNYMGVILDGAQSRICLTEKPDRERFVLAENLPDTEHTLMLFKRQDACHEVTFLGFELPEDAGILPPPAKPERRMEVYGDSVSAGEVAEAVEYTGKPDPEHNGEYSNAWFSYAWMTARKLKAELHDIAQGGIALMDKEGYFHAPDYIGMEHVWDKVRYQPEAGTVRKWDFARYTPHVVVAAVGQNDRHPVDYMKEDPAGKRAEIWKEHYKSWITALRGKYPQALIVLATTILEHDHSWDDAIGQVCRELDDKRIVHFLYRRNGCGTPGHIRIGEAEEMARELAAFIGSRW
ncbi:hypothetical protein BRYFOR_07200 [Marvinbryantia formatexigens DSM 14469]|uniref:Carbohydrate esterase 2 N-terminal domain-containing protein n=1 Tax=Marvinbryantia formatexigens DSM 14469 TaxID=478749 RepID=C6LEZ9_9FIRM|nr:hypothetical protein [Marvinbryantia formatexigens]EET60738.1 hypothetical protein BRYFOR_07200 [Marvinbryantia formatexigens DSM 14469]UWO22972.1 electron transporter RnfD [Marvinbryantia formatexigens DSM 14469]SDG33870.1 hypothetical protein SAMN05660368_02375 [Marvinbryantia formatexigens]